MAMIEVSEETLTQLFGLIRGVDSKISVLCATVQEKEKRCEQHTTMTADHETRLRKLEIWKAEQSGTSGFLWKIITVMCSVGALIVSAVAVMKQ